jgi:prenyltransferase beta subunit
MPFREYARKGIHFLLSNQNPDKGIPGTKPGDVSGCWTTAEALEIFLLSSHFQKEYIPMAKDMLRFLLDTKLPQGGWPLVVGSTQISTMATGHALAALIISKKVFSCESRLFTEINDAISNAEEWLKRNQNSDGGWGVEPESSYGKESRMISTCYALRGYFELGYTTENSKAVRNGIKYLLDIANKDGGWGGKMGLKSDPDNTARALIALIRSKKYDSSSPIIKKGVKFILKSRHSKSLWRVDTESYVSAGAPGETIFNANTPYDVLEAFIRCQYFGKEVGDLIQLFINSQEDDGRWYTANSHQGRPICTWPTSEAISVLDLAQEHYMKNMFQASESKSVSSWKLASIILTIATITQFLYICGFYNTISIWWSSLSESWKQAIIFGVIVALIIGIVVNVITSKLYTFLNRLKERSKNTEEVKK